MLTTQPPAVLPRIHSLYSELPPNSRRAANLPFFAPRTVPASSSASSSSSSPLCAPNNNATSNAPGIPPLTPRRNSIPRRNAISYHPSQPASQSPFVVQSQNQRLSSNSSSLAPPPALLASPRPRPAVLLTSGYTPESRPLVTSPPPLVVSLAPARVPRSQREYQAKMVANLLLNRASRARPMRCARRGSFLRAGYQPSSLSMSVLAGDVDSEEANLDDDLA
jgi:hypothetical protein